MARTGFDFDVISDPVPMRRRLPVQGAGAAPHAALQTAPETAPGAAHETAPETAPGALRDGVAARPEAPRDPPDAAGGRDRPS